MSQLMLSTAGPLELVPGEWRPPRPKSDTPDLPMTLPPELRNDIYELVLPSDQRLTFDGRKPKHAAESREPPLLKVSKQIREEASAMFYGGNHIWVILRLSTEHLSNFMQKCNSLVDLCGTSPFLKFSLSFMERNQSLWTLVDKLLPLLETMRDTGFEPDRAYHRQGDPLFQAEKDRSIESGRKIFNVGGHVALGETLGRAIALGRRARYEEWSAAKLEARFEELVKFVSTKSNRSRAKWPATL